MRVPLPKIKGINKLFAIVCIIFNFNSCSISFQVTRMTQEIKEKVFLAMNENQTRDWPALLGTVERELM